MSMSSDEAFRAQNSINLSLALIAAAFALMAGVLAGFFAVADKIPPMLWGRAVIPASVVAVLLCLISVFFGGRGISTTIKASATHPFPAAYDGGNFGWQGITGILGTLAVVLLIFSAIAISARAESDRHSASGSLPSNEVSRRLDRIQQEDAALLQRVGQLGRAEDGLAGRMKMLEMRLPQVDDPAKAGTRGAAPSAHRNQPDESTQ